MREGEGVSAAPSPLLLSSAGALSSHVPCQQGSPQTTPQAFRTVTRRNPENRDFEASSWGPPHDEPPTAFDDAWGGPFPEEGPGSDFPSRPDGQEGHFPGRLASPTGAGRGRGRPLLHETLLLGSRNSFRTTEHAETQKTRDLEASSWGPPHDKPFRATRQHSTTRGEALSRGGGLAQIFRAGHTGKVPSVTPVRGEGKFEGEGGSAPLPPRQGKGGSRKAFLAPWKGCSGLPGSQNFLLTPKALLRGKQDFNTLGQGVC